MTNINFFDGLFEQPRKQKKLLNVNYKDLTKIPSKKSYQKQKFEMIKRVEKLKKAKKATTPIIQGSTRQKDEISGFI